MLGRSVARGPEASRNAPKRRASRIGRNAQRSQAPTGNPGALVRDQPAGGRAGRQVEVEVTEVRPTAISNGKKSAKASKEEKPCP